jgi:hypothetical protein
VELYVCYLYYSVMVCIGATFDWCHLNQVRIHADLNHVWCRQADFKSQLRSGVSDTYVYSFFGGNPFLSCLHIFIISFYEKLACHMMG